MQNDFSLKWNHLYYLYWTLSTWKTLFQIWAKMIFFNLWRALSSSQEVAYQSSSEAPLIYSTSILKMTFQKGPNSWRCGEHVNHWLISHLLAVRAAETFPVQRNLWLPVLSVSSAPLHILTLLLGVMLCEMHDVLRVCRLNMSRLLSQSEPSARLSLQ